jgi:hypothetical protein
MPEQRRYDFQLPTIVGESHTGTFRECAKQARVHHPVHIGQTQPLSGRQGSSDSRAHDEGTSWKNRRHCIAPVAARTSYADEGERSIMMGRQLQLQKRRLQLL